MDHLPEVLGAKAPLPRVPCTCDPTLFDGMEFESFPIRKGFKLIEENDEYPKFILNADGSSLEPEALNEIVQAWLFFGLLIEVLKVSGVTVDVEDFVQRESGNKYITTKILPRYFSEWERNESLLPKKERKLHFRRQQQMIMISTQFRLYQISGQWWQDELLYWTERPKESYVVALPLPFQMSIAILCDTLDRASRRAFGNLGDGFVESLLQNRALIDELKANAWCPSEISLILEGMDDTSAFFASRLERRRLKADHSHCTANKCLAFNVVTESYKTAHTTDCSGCPDVSIANQQLSSTLQRGLIPRAQLNLANVSGDSSPEVTIRESGPYIAISHVWSDGLGNPNANALPTCQLLRLHGMADALNLNFPDGNPSVWIDSLLVPVKKGYEKKLALSRLCDYYRAADKVLVLDSDLLWASKACTKEELICRVFFSTWMRRLWTLEEGVLSRENLEFQLCDGSVSMLELCDPSHFSSSITGIGDTFRGSLQGSIHNLATQRQIRAESNNGQSFDFASLLYPLEYRSTTKVIDEPLCLAHIIGLDASELVSIDDVQLRSKRLIELLAEDGFMVPMRLLFTKERKLQLDGFRWAPTTFMDFESQDVSYLRQDSKRSNTSFIDKGLLINGIGSFLLNFGSDSIKKVTYAEVDHRIYALTPVPIDKDCRSGPRFWTPEMSTEALVNDRSQQWNSDMQALLGKSPENTAVLRGGSFGLLVSISHAEGRASDPGGSLIYARPISQLYVQELETANQNYSVCGVEASEIKFTNPNWDFAETERQMRQALEMMHDPESSTYLRCRAIDPSQRWCIG